MHAHQAHHAALLTNRCLPACPFCLFTLQLQAPASSISASATSGWHSTSPGERVSSCSRRRGAGGARGRPVCPCKEGGGLAEGLQPQWHQLRWPACSVPPP